MKNFKEIYQLREVRIDDPEIEGYDFSAKYPQGFNIDEEGDNFSMERCVDCGASIPEGSDLCNECAKSRNEWERKREEERINEVLEAFPKFTRDQAKMITNYNYNGGTANNYRIGEKCKNAKEAFGLTGEETKKLYDFLKSRDSNWSMSKDFHNKKGDSGKWKRHFPAVWKEDWIPATMEEDPLYTGLFENIYRNSKKSLREDWRDEREKPIRPTPPERGTVRAWEKWGQSYEAGGVEDWWPINCECFPLVLGGDNSERFFVTFEGINPKNKVVHMQAWSDSHGDNIVPTGSLSSHRSGGRWWTIMNDEGEIIEDWADADEED